MPEDHFGGADAHWRQAHLVREVAATELWRVSPKPVHIREGKLAHLGHFQVERVEAVVTHVGWLLAHAHCFADASLVHQEELLLGLFELGVPDGQRDAGCLELCDGDGRPMLRVFFPSEHLGHAIGPPHEAAFGRSRKVHLAELLAPVCPSAEDARVDAARRPPLLRGGPLGRLEEFLVEPLPLVPFPAIFPVHGRAEETFLVGRLDGAHLLASHPAWNNGAHAQGRVSVALLAAVLGVLVLAERLLCRKRFRAELAGQGQRRLCAILPLPGYHHRIHPTLVPVFAVAPVGPVPRIDPVVDRVEARGASVVAGGGVADSPGPLKPLHVASRPVLQSA